MSTAVTTLDAPVRPPVQATPRQYDPDRRAVGGPLLNVAAAVVTAGLLPAMWWPVRWGRDVAADRLAWLRRIERLRERDPVNTDLRHADDRLRPRYAVEAIAFFAGVVALVSVTVVVSTCPTPQLAFDFLFHRRHAVWQPIDFDTADRARTIWRNALLVSYLVCWYAVRSHTSAVADVVGYVNRKRKQAGLPKFKNSANRAHVGLLWIVAVIVFCFHGAWWAIPMALAGGLQRRYMERSSEELRTGVDQTLASLPRPVVSYDDSSAVRYCATAGCGRRLPGVARFCPRCGATTPASVGAYSIL